MNIRFNVAFFYAFVLMTWLKEIIGCSSGNREVIIVLKTVVCWFSNGDCGSANTA